MRPQEIIAKKRDGDELTIDQIDLFIAGVRDGTWADYQISAMVMAMFIRGLSQAEQAALTYAMLHSGEILDLSEIDLPKADKHSTGGVGDKTSLIIAPIVAACGVAVPMISGRGLGHTGGTLDKLESIPGYKVDIPITEFRKILEKCGFAMMGQTAEIAPADKKLYALRDATATVPYIPLIVASIMSKKLAEGLDALVLDVKTGSGAFMPQLEDSIVLADSMVKIGIEFGVKTLAVVTDMNQPLGWCVGNANEVYECIRVLKGERDPQSEDLRALSIDLAAHMVHLAGIENSFEAASATVERKLENGQAFERFIENCSLQGGDVSIGDDPANLLDKAMKEIIIKAEDDGFVVGVDALSIAEAIVEIGGGRRKADDEIDHSVGYFCEKKVGDVVQKGEPVGRLTCRSIEHGESVRKRLRSAYNISENPTPKPELIKALIRA